MTAAEPVPARRLGPVRAVWLAFSWLTVLPIPQPRVVWDRRAGGAAIAAVPVVGVVLGIVVAAAAFGLSHTSLPDALIGLLCVLLLLAATRGMHLDGLADTADGLGCYGDPARVREVMRGGTVGPFGVAAIVLCLLGQSLAFAALATEHRWYALAFAIFLGRALVPLACRRGIGPANPNGFGALTAGTQRFSIVVWLTLTAAAAAAAGWLDSPGPAATFDVTPMVTALCWAAALTLAAWLFTRHCARRMAGLSGDVLGAVIELTTTAAAVLLLV